MVASVEAPTRLPIEPPLAVKASRCGTDSDTTVRLKNALKCNAGVHPHPGLSRSRQAQNRAVSLLRSRWGRTDDVLRESSERDLCEGHWRLLKWLSN